MPQFHSLEQPPLEKVEKLTRELGKYPEIKPRLTFLFPVNKNRETALEMIKSEEINQGEVLKLLESKDFIEKEVGFYLFNKIPKLSKEVGEKALPILEKMSQDEDEDYFIKEAAAQARIKIIIKTQSGEKALPILEKMSQDKEWTVRVAVAQGLGQIGEKALPILEKMGQNEKWFVSVIIAVAQGLGQIGEKALPILEKMGQNKDYFVREAVNQELGKIGEKALPILKRMSQQDEYKNVREAATKELNKSKKTEFNSWLLATKKPLFATQETKKLAEKIVELEEITKELKEEFKDDFVGIVIFGSTAKGYSEKESDIDWGIIAKNPEVSKCFKKLANQYNLNLCSEHYVEVDKNYQAVSHQEIPFYGLFFGDHKQLQKLQKTILENIDEIEWDDIRRKIKKNENNLSKAFSRYNLTDDEMEKTKQFVSLLRVPPSYQEALKLVRSRGKK